MVSVAAKALFASHRLNAFSLIVASPGAAVPEILTALANHESLIIVYVKMRFGWATKI